MPTYFWGNLQISHFDRSQHPLKVDLQSIQSNFLAAFKSLYPELSLSELAEIYTLWAPHQLEPHKGFWGSWEDFFKAYQLKWNDNLSRTLLALSKTPQPFQSWSMEKKLKPRDLEVLKTPQIFEALQTSHTQIDSLLTTIPQLALSKQDAVEALELCLEMWLINPEVTFDPIPQPLKWLESLRAQRYPRSFERLHAQQRKLQELSWPKNMKHQWTRQGDLSGIDVQFLAHSHEDLKLKIESLQKIYAQIDLQKESFWKS